jgi:hypothetical protein
MKRDLKMRKKMIWLISLFLFFANASGADLKTDPDCLAKEFVGLLAQGEYETAVGKFDPTLRQVFPVNKLKETWEAVLAQYGKFQRQIATRQETWQQYKIVYVTVKFAKAVLDLKVVYNTKNEIAGLFFLPGQLGQAGKARQIPKGVCEKGLTINNQKWTLPATLSLPEKNGQFPAVILVHGSGPQDLNCIPA